MNGGKGGSCLTRELLTFHAGEQTLAFTVRSGDWSTVAKRGGRERGGVVAEQTSSHFDHSTTEYSVTVLLKGRGGVRLTNF